MNAVMPYRIPIFLWSTVVSQLQKPVVAVGRRNRPPGRSAGTLTVAIVVSFTSLQRVKERDQLVDLLGVRS